MRTKIAALLLAVACAAQAGTLNDQYRLSGDAAGVGVVQAFDDGLNLYVQMRDPTRPPAPIGPVGAVDYRIRGMYLVLPLMRTVRLVRDGYEARIEAEGVAAGVAAVAAPVDVPSPLLANPRSDFLPPPASPQPRRVEGDVIVQGDRPVAAPVNPAAPAKATTRQEVPLDVANSLDLAHLHGRVTVTADGTAKGAAAAQSVRARCPKGVACTIRYAGAPAGKLIIEETTDA